GGGAGLGLEPEAHVGTSRHVGTQELDGHRALQPPVEASVDVGHAAAPQQSSQLVPLGDQLGFARGLHPRLCTPSGYLRTSWKYTARASPASNPCARPSPATSRSSTRWAPRWPCTSRVCPWWTCGVALPRPRPNGHGPRTPSPSCSPRPR